MVTEIVEQNIPEKVEEVISIQDAKIAISEEDHIRMAREFVLDVRFI